MPGIFISYRRADSPDATGRIYDRLVADFGRASVFKDVDSIPLGRDFRSHLSEMVGQCAVVLAIIGPHWTDVRDDAGKRRLEDADDFVRIELEAALARNIPVVPVLVGHAVMPTVAQLPASLAQLAYRQSIEVHPDPDFHHTATRLVTALRAMLDPKAAALAASTLAGGPQDGSAKRPGSRSLRRDWTFAALGAVAALVAALPLAFKHLHEVPPPEQRVELVTSGTGDSASLALSPDGRQIVYVAWLDGKQRLWLRSLDSTVALTLPGTEDGQFPFWSPDGRSIGFFTGVELKRLDLGGGAPRILTPAVTGRGGTWNEAGVLLFSQATGSPLARIAATGGEVQTVTQLLPGQTSHRAPQFLPDGRRFLYLALGTPEASGIYLGSLDGDAPVRLANFTVAGVYLRSGWLLRPVNGSLVAQRLDLKKSALTGPVVTLANDVDVQEILATGLAALTASSNGTIAYRATGANGIQLTWFDRSGSERGVFGGAAATGYAVPRISPDGQRVIASRSGDLWLLDGTRNTRFTFEPGKVNLRSSWSPDGTRIAWGAADALYVKSASGAGENIQLDASAGIKSPGGWTPDGRFLMYHSTTTTGTDLWLVAVEKGAKPTPYLQTAFNEAGGTFSPDGRWVAYQSDESGRFEIYVRRFVPPGKTSTGTEAEALRWQVSTTGGAFPMWRRDGKELYFLNPVAAMMAAPIDITGPTPVRGAPMELFRTRIFGGMQSGVIVRTYDVAADGRFLINTLPADINKAITIVQNWNPEAQGGQ